MNGRVAPASGCVQGGAARVHPTNGKIVKAHRHSRVVITKPRVRAN
jgi:hypothetical protein